jgi:hypothetical protein
LIPGRALRRWARGRVGMQNYPHSRTFRGWWLVPRRVRCGVRGWIRPRRGPQNKTTQRRTGTHTAGSVGEDASDHVSAGSLRSRPCHRGKVMKDAIALTTAMIHAGRSGSGGWTRKQVELLGVTWPPVTGWVDRLAGSVVDRDKYERFLALKGKTRRKRGSADTGTASMFPEDES